jgi:RNA polymerase sigma-70 factor (ECF subfamily)
MMEDIELIRRFRNGDESGFDELVRRYRQRIYAVVYRLVRNPEDAAELAQDVFVRAYRALGKFREESGFYTWLYRIAVNASFSFLKSRRGRRKADAGEQLDQEAVMNLPSADYPLQAFEQARQRDAIAAAVDRLPDRQRTVFVMRQYQDLANDEIARVLKCPVGTVKANYFFAVRNLRQRLKDCELRTTGRGQGKDAERTRK